MVPNPLALIAEITHRCPLHCAYCSNPLQLAGTSLELTTQEWVGILQQASKLGVLHLHLTGGEPLARLDLTELVDAAHATGLYTNLITSGVGLSETRIKALVKAGLDHVQLSFQDSRESSADWIAGARAHALKVELAPLIRRSGVAFTINMVVHRQNLDHLEEMIALAESLHPDRMEIAHVQYYGWAFENRDALLPTHDQVDASLRTVAAARDRLAGRIHLEAVVPDYYARYPKACMGGWGRQQLIIDPAGKALPCHAAGVIPGLRFESVREHSLEWIWGESDAFQRFRGDQWMPEPCRSCDRRALDFGGCRCQAFLVAGDAASTDPACSLAPKHALIEEVVARVNANSVSAAHTQVGEQPEGFWSYRRQPGR
jgi:pyrroloquinoline quinone biosynthesis protein E